MRNRCRCAEGQRQGSRSNHAADRSLCASQRSRHSFFALLLGPSTGANADAIKYSELVLQIDRMSPWTQRAAMLRATLPPSAAAPEPDKAATPATPSAIQFSPKK